MKDTYNYEKNIQVVKTVNDDIVLTMNKEIFTSLRNCIYDAAEQRRKEGYEATAMDNKGHMQKMTMPSIYSERECRPCSIIGLLGEYV